MTQDEQPVRQNQRISVPEYPTEEIKQVFREVHRGLLKFVDLTAMPLNPEFIARAHKAADELLEHGTTMNLAAELCIGMKETYEIISRRLELTAEDTFLDKGDEPDDQ